MTLPEGQPRRRTVTRASGARTNSASMLHAVPSPSMLDKKSKAQAESAVERLRGLQVVDTAVIVNCLDTLCAPVVRVSESQWETVHGAFEKLGFSEYARLTPPVAKNRRSQLRWIVGMAMYLIESDRAQLPDLIENIRETFSAELYTL